MVSFKDFYFENIKLLWPYNLYKYREDLALSYLVRHGYDVELALALIGKFVLTLQVYRAK